MNNLIKILLVFLFLGLSFSFAFEVSELKDNAKEKLNKINIFKKKQPKPRQKMVETKQEWEIEAQNVPLLERDLTKKEEMVEIKSQEEKIIKPELKYTFDRYNYPQGKREVDIQDIKTKLHFYPYVVADKNVRYIAYPYYYFSPDLNQISSNFFVEKLDTSLTKTKRILNYRHIQQERIPIIEAGTKETYPNLFNGLTLVDWSADGTKLLIKEKVGSTFGGVYKTFLYVHYMPTEVKNSKTVKLDILDAAIREYYLEWEDRQLIKYRYDIEPLGFSAENDDIVIVLCYVYDKENNKIFLGAWGYDCLKNQVILFSKTDCEPQISINGLILKHSL